MNDVYICRDCETWHLSYEDLKHYDNHNGGFCTTCGGSDLLLESEMDDDQKEFYIGRNNACSIQYDDSIS